MEAKLTDSAGTEIPLGTFTPDPATGGKLKVPAGVWGEGWRPGPTCS